MVSAVRWAQAPAKNLTLSIEYMTTTTVWDEDITTKYITASLLTVPRILDRFTPGCIDLMCCTCTMTNAKTATSKGMDGRFKSGNGGVERSDRMLTKDEREGCLSDYRGSSKIRETQVIRIQRNRKWHPSW